MTGVGPVLFKVVGLIFLILLLLFLSVLFQEFEVRELALCKQLGMLKSSFDNLFSF